MRDYTTTKSNAARRLGISASSFTQALESGRTELQLAPNGDVLVSSLLRELNRRNNILINALTSKSGQCPCCHEELNNTASTFLPGHDSVLRSALSSAYHGTEFDQQLARTIIHDLGKTVDEYIHQGVKSHQLKPVDEQ